VNPLPTERDLPPAARDAARARAVAAVAQPPARSRRWLPLAAAAAAVAVVGGSALVVSGPEPAAIAPAAPTTRTKPSPPPEPPPPPAPPPPTQAPAPPGTPSVAEVRRRCPLPPQSRYLTRYVGDGAVTWLFVQPERMRTSTVCTWKVGSPGRMADFANDWLVPPTPGGRYDQTRDNMRPNFGADPVPPEYAHLERDRWVLVGHVPDAATAVLIRTPDGVHAAGFAEGWFVFHYRGEDTKVELFGYDANGDVVPWARPPR
jgi:hypothetical protein